MAKHRIHRKLARSDEQIACEKEVRKTFQAKRPTLNDLLATGDYTEPMTQQEYWDTETLDASADDLDSPHDAAATS